MAFGAISRYHFYWFLHPKSIISTGRARYHFQKFSTVVGDVCVLDSVVDNSNFVKKAICEAALGLADMMFVEYQQTGGFVLTYS